MSADPADNTTISGVDLSQLAPASSRLKNKVVATAVAAKDSVVATSDAAKAAMAATKEATAEKINQAKSGTISKLEVMNKPQSTKKWTPIKMVLVGLVSLLLFFLAVSGVLGWHTYTTAKELQYQAGQLQITGQQVVDAIKGQDLTGAQGRLQEARTQFETTRSVFNRLGYYRFIPFARAYYKDGQQGFIAAEAGLRAAEKSLNAVVPYADVLGLTPEVEGQEDQNLSSEDRVKLLLETIKAIEPELDSIAADLDTANQALASIEANRYPETLRGQEIRPLIIKAQDGVKQADEALNQYRPILLRLPSITGSTEEGRRKYLVLFQNDNELRPTRGFLTAYAIINMENGKVEAEKSDDIYELDLKVPNKGPIPEKLGKYLTSERRLNLRDMNISPDFRLSMDDVVGTYKTVKGEPQDIDGIIAVDTEVLTALLRVLGPVNVNGQTFSAETTAACDCPQVVYALSEIITRPTPYLRDDRKGILGPLMREILFKVYGGNKSQLPMIVQTGFEALQGRHLQMYFFNEEDQKAAELINGAGRMTPPAENQDFLAIINANLAGAKSNLFITYDVEQEVTRGDGTIEKTVKITYENPRRGDNCNLEAGLLCLNAGNNDWTRLYVPKGSTLISAQGFQNTPETYEENGFTVFDGFFKLEPSSTATLVVTYTVPYTDANNYTGYFWKQGGVTDYKLLLDVEGDQQEVLVNKDTAITTPFQ